ncbi:unnamed protein product [Rangifer tarandus platyrhynchus]|uniref:Uncharacterized protein n=2 Tax=Rangifer tarandus platyrhynchus TaxID=3082113 RepID=A0ABN8YID9_RANTA|nr:unnamed protein product [Rangifer tarandus platyrhynchus]
MAAVCHISIKYSPLPVAGPDLISSVPHPALCPGRLSDVICYGLNACGHPPPPIHMLKPESPVCWYLEVGPWEVLEELCYKWEALINRIGALIREVRGMSVSANFFFPLQFLNFFILYFWLDWVFVLAVQFLSSWR